MRCFFVYLHEQQCQIVLMDVADFSFDQIWRPAGKDKERLFNIPLEIAQNDFVEQFAKRLKDFKNVVALGGDGFNLLFYNDEPIKDGEFLHMMLDLPKMDAGVIFLNMDHEEQGFDISDELRDELITIIGRSGLDVMEIDREDDEEQEDEDGQNNRKSNCRSKDDRDEDIIIPEVEVLPTAIWRDVLINYISMNKRTKEQDGIFNAFMEKFSQKKLQSLTLVGGCLQISGMNKTEDVIFCSIVMFEKKLKLNMVVGGKAFMLNCSKTFGEWLRSFLDMHSKGGYAAFEGVGK